MDFSKQKKTFKLIIKQRQLIMMTIPVLVSLVLFNFIPLWGWYMAFVDYKIGRPFTEQTFVGLKHFITLFSDVMFKNALRNTLIMSVLGITINGFIMPIFFAVLLNEIRVLKFKKAVQTVSYLPHFVSWVVAAGIVIQSLSIENGIINDVLMGLRIIDSPINFLSYPKYFYGIVTISNLWKSLGWSSIIFLAAITGVDPELAEAANVDGAGRLRRIWHITIPAIMPVVTILLIMSISGLLGANIEVIMLLSNPITIETADVLPYYALRYGIRLGRYSFGTAVGIFTSVIAVILVYTANVIARRYSETSLF